MNKEKIQEVITRFDRGDDYIVGMILFDLPTGEIVTTTYKEQDEAETIVRVEQLRDKLKTEELEKLQSLKEVGAKVTWSMASFERVIYAAVRIKDEMYLAIEFDVKKAPSAALEDLLEMGVVLGHYL